MQTKKFTLGEFRVGIDFNVSGSADVDEIKRIAADFINLLEAKKKKIGRDNSLASEQFRLIAHAQTLVEDAAMNGVKAVTKNLNVEIISD